MSTIHSTTTPTSFQLCFYYLSKIQDVGAYNNTSDVVNRFYPCMMSGLAYYLSLKYAPERDRFEKLFYEDENTKSGGSGWFGNEYVYYTENLLS